MITRLEMTKFQRILLGTFGLALMCFGISLKLFDFIFPPAPPPRGWSPPQGNFGKVIDKIKQIIDEKVKEFVNS